jgi:hypothetical protein
MTDVDTGVVDEHVEIAQTGDRFGDDALARVSGGEVPDHHQVTGSGQARAHLLGSGSVPPGVYCHPVSGGRERLGDGGTDASARAGHQAAGGHTADATEIDEASPST